MKIMFHGCAMLFFVLAFQLSQAQHRYRPYPDSIRIEMPDSKMVILMEMKDFIKDISVLEQFPDTLSLWMAAVEKSTTQTTSPRRVEIKQIDRRTDLQVIEPEEKSTHLSIQSGVTTELLPPGWEVFIQTDRYKAHVYAQSFDALKNFSQKDFLPAVDFLRSEYKKFPTYRQFIESRIVIKDSKVAYSDYEHLGPHDYLIINGSAGLGLLGDKFYPELNLELALRFGAKNGHNREKIIFSSNNLFFGTTKPDGGFQLSTNSFINVSWNKNLDSGDKNSWLGVGAGYLFHNSGGYFQGTTFKFFLNKDVGNIRISPELYLSDGFHNQVWGIKFNFVF